MYSAAHILDQHELSLLPERDGQAPVAGRSFRTRSRQEPLWIERQVALYPDGSIIQVVPAASSRSIIMGHLIEILKREARSRVLEPKVRRRPRHW
jgi:hypothetical protein